MVTYDGKPYVISTINYTDGRCERIALSVEVCPCGKSYKRRGVGYADDVARVWLCKHCGRVLAHYGTEADYEREQTAIFESIGMNRMVVRQSA